jgi:hypothetical protein
MSAAKVQAFRLALPHLVGRSGKGLRIARDEHHIGASFRGC